MDILDPRLLDPRLFLPFCPQTPELGSPPGPETPPRRKRSPELTRDHKLQIRTLHFIAGWTHKAILERLAPAEIPHLTLRQIRGACKAGPLTPQKPGRVGPKAKVTEEQKAQIKAFIEEDPKHCHGEGSMVRLSHGPAKYSEETVDSKLKREEREREALPLRL